VGDGGWEGEGVKTRMAYRTFACVCESEESIPHASYNCGSRV
jgi:hypothetical protein